MAGGLKVDVGGADAAVKEMESADSATLRMSEATASIEEAESVVQATP